MYDVYGAYRYADMNEGRGPMVLDRVFSKAADAQTYINKQRGVQGRVAPEHGWQNSEMGDWQVKPIHVLAHPDDSEEYENERIRRFALSKLSPIERRLLGLT